MDHSLEFTQHVRDVIEARGIDPAWVTSAVSSPEARLREIRDAQLTHALRRIPEHGNRALRVVYNHTVAPPMVVTASFDRTLKGKL